MESKKLHETMTDQIIELLSELEDLRRAACKLAPELPQNISIRKLYCGDDEVADFGMQFRRAATHNTALGVLWDRWHVLRVDLCDLLRSAP